MVIQCPACQTRFRLADEKIGPNGVQVRCSKCAHTFPVKKEAATSPASGGFQSPPVSPVDVTKSFPLNGASNPAAQLEPSQPGRTSPFAQPAPDAPIPVPPAAPPAAKSPFAAPPSAPAADPFGGAPAGGPFGAAPAANPFAPPPTPQKPRTPPSSIPGWGPPEATPSAPSSPPGWPSAAAPSAPSAPAAPPPTETAGMPSWMAGNAAGDGGAPAVDLPGDPFASLTGGTPPPDAMSGMDQASPELDPSVRAALLGGATPDLTGDANGGMQLSSDIAPPMGAPAPPSGPSRGVEAPWSQGGGTAKERVAIAVEERRKKERRKKGREVLSIKVDAPREPRAAYRLLMLLFFVGAGLGAFASLTDGSFDPARLDRARLSLLTGESPPAAPGVEGITLSGLDGGFVDTDPGRPRLFVASGVASNHSAATKGKLRVRGVLRDPSGKEIAASGELWCGNTFRDDQLKDFRSMKELTNAYTDVGDRNSNLKIPPGGHVPCTVVFFDAPQPGSVSDFELEIVAAQSLPG